MMRKHYNKFLIRLIGAFSIIGITGLFSSCINEDPIDNTQPKQTTLLIYAVATNSLSGNLVSDKNEMIQAASQIDLNKNNILLFETKYQYLEDNSKAGNVNLLKLVKDKQTGVCSWEIVKDYNDGTASLDPSRVTEIINHVTNGYPADNYGLVFWSHSTASQPYFDDNTSTLKYSVIEETNKVSVPMQYSFGQDIPVGNGNPAYQINIDDLANAIPDNLFDYIWFDSCYMSNIETIYQFRDKCKTFVGYPTEVLDAGLPYQNVLPFMVGKTPDLIHAAELFLSTIPIVLQQLQ